MTGPHSIVQSKLFASVIIAVYNDWRPLARCLQALAAQTDASRFEIVVVDDGSTDPAPAWVRDWHGPHVFKLVSQSHSGTAAARNQGIRDSSGELLVFIDADCLPESDCLAALASCVAVSPGCNYFQLHLAGEPSNLAGRAEELRLIVTQDFLLQPDGRIRYLNTAGFAIRRSAVDTGKGLFYERVQRGEDTLLLANLLQRNQLPLFVPSAVIRHTIDLGVLQCLWKDVRSALAEAKTQAIIATKGVSVRVSHLERFEMLRAIWCVSKSKTIGRAACLLLIARQAIRFVILAVCEVLPGSRLRGTVVLN